MFSLGRFKAQLLVFICLLLTSFVLFMPEAPAADSNKLSSSNEVLEVLGESRGNTLLAFIDSPFDQSDGLRHLKGALSQYALELNGQPVGTTGLNTLLHVTPRIGLNRLIIQDLFDRSSVFEVSFPAMRSAGVPTSIVEVVTFSDPEEIRATSLRSVDVKTIEKALTRSVDGGMDRVFELIRKRGQELVSDDPSRKKWSSGVRSGEDDREWHSNSDSVNVGIERKQALDAQALKERTLASDVADLGQASNAEASKEMIGADQTIETDENDGLNSAPEIKDKPDKPSYKVSADRR